MQDECTQDLFLVLFWRQVIPGYAAEVGDVLVSLLLSYYCVTHARIAVSSLGIDV